MHTPSRRLAGRVALVTGASKGLGRAIAVRLAREGAAVGLVARGRAALDAVAAEIADGRGRAQAVAADAYDERGAAEAAGAVEAALGPIDLLVNNVGRFLGKPFEAMTAGDWDSLAAGKPRAAFLFTRAVLPGMLARRRGHIVCILSGGAYDPAPGFAAFAAAEFAVRGMVRSLAEEVRERGVHVGLVAPRGAIETERTRGGHPGDPRSWLDPEDLADAVVFLATQGPRALTVELVVSPPAPLYR